MKKKRRLKPPSDARSTLPALAEKKSLVSPSRDTVQEPEEPPNQEEPLDAGPLPLDQDDEPVKTLPDDTPPSPAPQQVSPDPPVDKISTPTPPRVDKSARKMAPLPKLEPSHFKSHLQAADSTSVIDEFSPKKIHPTRDTIESSVEGSQVSRAVKKPHRKSSNHVSVNNVFDGDFVQNMQSITGACFELNGQIKMLVEEQPPTVSNVGQYTLYPFFLQIAGH